MPITINGSGTVTGISAGGLPDGCIVTADIVDNNITEAKTGTAPIYGCRAWVNFDGTRNEADTGASTNGANVKIRASGNVTSVLKNGTGDYTVTFTTAMVDANYSFVITGNNITGVGNSAFGVTTYTGSSIRMLTTDTSSVVRDLTSTSVAIFR